VSKTKTVHTPDKLIKKDKVIVSVDSIDELFQWKDNNKDLVRKFTPILIDIVLQIGAVFVHVSESKLPKYVFQFDIYEGNQNQHTCYWNNKTWELFAPSNEGTGYTKATGISINDYQQSIITLYATLMAYMEHYRETVEKHLVSTKKPVSKKKQKKTGKSVTYIRNTVYTLTGVIDDKQMITNIEEGKRAYTKPDNPFKVRGHWRHYKSGKTTWVPSYVKNKQEGKEPEQRIYKL
jgi:hypothetical protein